MTELEKYRSDKFTELCSGVTAQEIKELPLSYMQAFFITGFDKGVEYTNNKQQFNERDMCNFVEFSKDKLMEWQLDIGDNLPQKFYNSEELLKQFIEER